MLSNGLFVYVAIWFPLNVLSLFTALYLIRTLRSYRLMRGYGASRRKALRCAVWPY